MEEAKKMVAKLELVSLKEMGDDRGWLVVFEKGLNIPFDVKRCFFIYGTKEGLARGFHAHKKSKQMLVSVSGSVEIHCEANGKKEVYLLDAPNKGLFLEGMVWHTMENFSSDCVLMVLADDYYNEDDYIRNYDEFCALTNKENAK